MMPGYLTSLLCIRKRDIKYETTFWTFQTNNIQKECANDFINFLLKYQVKQKTVVIPQCNRTEICAAPIKLGIKDFSFS